MTSGIVSLAERDIADIEEELVDFTSDLLTLRRHESILNDLFENSAGSWLKLEALLEDKERELQEIRELQSRCKDDLQMTWLHHPELSQGYCLVLFYVGSINQ